ncbi:HVO_2523 family zinc finger protein [Natronolimnohabitans sp. A-GB9]|uniref:HVO_2523 family zinc finger protein n=1 Tax=Natronolimnohabitans sp. A-GB9 TaxID=3069757 RepID=UPI0027B1D878|nr:HVO_2523 family zinc finger protein [Natronolimnohabitans sp. A-GB9]MDQ2051346.1 HVO_2523 family zinc finger protein [Natronolimnohabitans sp. A-GB9]
MAADQTDGIDTDTADVVRSDSSGAPTCPHCGEPLYKRHCKYVCPQHGPIIDCSDPFR